MLIDDPAVVAEVRPAFDGYEHARVTNDVAALYSVLRDRAADVRYCATGEKMRTATPISRVSRGATRTGLAPRSRLA